MPSFSSACRAASCSAAFFVEPAARAELLAVDHGGADEATVVCRALDREHEVLHLRAAAGQRLLQLRLVVDVARARVVDPLAERLHDRRLDGRETVLEVDGGDRGLEHRCEHVPAAREPLELRLGHVARPRHQPLAQTELLRHAGAAVPRDDMRPDLRQTPFRGLGEALVQLARDRELEHGVAEELEPLVRVATVRRPRRVGEDLLELAPAAARRSAARARRCPRGSAGYWCEET